VSSEAGQVVRIDPAKAAVVTKVGVGANPLGSAFVGGELWVPNIDGGTISIVDPATNAVRTTLQAGSGPLSVAAAGGDAWISVSNDGEVWRMKPQSR
jgi:YVTN family beta-propeller protein